MAWYLCGITQRTRKGDWPPCPIALSAHFCQIRFGSGRSPSQTMTVQGFSCCHTQSADKIWQGGVQSENRSSFGSDNRCPFRINLVRICALSGPFRTLCESEPPIWLTCPLICNLESDAVKRTYILYRNIHTRC